MIIASTELPAIHGFLHEAGLSGRPEWRRSTLDGPVVMAREGERIIGAGRFTRSWLHPSRWRLSLFVEPDCRRRGVGSTLLDALAERLPTGERAMQAAASASEAGDVAFLGQVGFELLMTTRFGILYPPAVPATWWSRVQTAVRKVTNAGLRVVTLAEHPDMSHAAAIAHERLYRSQHAWNPPIALSLEQAQKLFLDPDELIPHGQFFAMQGNRIAGMASVRSTRDPLVLDLGWTGTIDAPREWRESIELVLLGRCLDAATRCGSSIARESDRVDPVLNAIVDGLPVEWEPDWVTYARS